MDMDRETFLLGRAALKTKIKALAAAQKREKGVLRIIRKLSKTEEEKTAALVAADFKPGDLPTSGRCWLRRIEITAYLNLYAQIRGRASSNPPGKDYCPYTYSKYTREAQALFDQATKPTPVA